MISFSFRFELFVKTLIFSNFAFNAKIYFTSVIDDVYLCIFLTRLHLHKRLSFSIEIMMTY